MLWVARTMANVRKMVRFSDALGYLETTKHRPGCQCHRCLWATGVRAGRVGEGQKTCFFRFLNQSDPRRNQRKRQ